MRVYRMTEFERDEYRDALIENGLIDEDATEEEVIEFVNRDFAMADALQFSRAGERISPPNRIEGFRPPSLW